MIHHLFGRVGRLVRSNFYALIEKIEYSESKEKLIQAMVEIDAALDEIKAEVGRLAAIRHTTTRRRQNTLDNHHDLDSQIKAALKAGRDTEAQTAIKKQIEIESEIFALDDQLAQLGEDSQAMEVCLNALKAKREILADVLAQINQSAAAMDSDRQTVDYSSVIDSRLKEKIANADLAFERIMASQAESEIRKKSRAGASEKLRQLEEMALKTKMEKRLAQAKQGMKKND